ncbi:hypothetical protein DV515_00015049 [Chloebia gouldiae]|uniref:Uncharacterized protein n=1 Tax=Chloebia gouldiae TaxID=44316 RepID=A0A3L8RXS7_CHLGU|nr:hypothetical protein DV515_00015049 [Chloebia gouldiae]
MLFLREAMPYHRVFRLVLLTLCSILVPAVLAEALAMLFPHTRLEVESGDDKVLKPACVKKIIGT